jgi:fructoselysine-6-P-deglycase FrlB-like protein
MEIMDAALGVVLFTGDEPTAGLVFGMARSAQEAGARVVLFDASGAEEAIPGVTVMGLPRAQGMAAILTALPAMQRFMLGFAAQRVIDVGTPRRSSKITRTE